MASGNLEILPADAVANPFLKPGEWWHTEGDRVVCDLCPRRCVMKDGDRGFCFVRQNIGNEMMLTTYGRSTGFCIDPIEKKPLNHFYPGTSVLSFGTAGCNLGCKFCQNWDISKSRQVERLSELAMPADIANAAKQTGCHSVAFTYNDPIIWAEYAIETARECHKLGIKTVAVTAGYITPQARGPFFEFMDAANVDLKAFSEEFYYRITLSHLEPILETLQWLKAETDVWFEITNLVIPDANDKPDEIREMCDWILKSVGDLVPLHFSAFHPDYRMTDTPATPHQTLIEAREIAQNCGLKYVYVGNVDDAQRQSTYCANCGQLVIERNHYQLGTYSLDGNHCAHCRHTIPGEFAHSPGTWGRRRLPVDMKQFTSQRLETPQPHQQESITTETKGPTTMATSASKQLELSDEQMTLLHNTAAEIIIAAALRKKPAATALDANELGNQSVAGTFVSLKRKGQLRSCCGTFGQMMPLRQSLSQSATRTATDDPRFPRISPSELEALDLELWLLHDTEAVEEKGAARINAVTVGKHGLQVIRGDNRGLLLPGVPIDHGWNSEEFLDQVCIKAGLPPTAWREDSTVLLRFRGDSFSRPLTAGRNPEEWSQPQNLFSSRDFAAYKQHCQTTLETLMNGGTPLYYCPSVSDANVLGVFVIASRPGTDQQLTSSKLSWRQTVPLQATLFSILQDVAGALSGQGLRLGEFDLDFAVASDVALHGVAANPDLNGFDSAERGLLVVLGNTTAFVYDRTLSPQELLAATIDLAEISDPKIAQVMSFQVQSSRDRISMVSRPQAAQGLDVRPPGVAGTFYPGDPNEMARMRDSLLEGTAKPQRFTAAVVPHAGWQYSGKIAADVLKRIEFPKRVIAIGPKHTPHGVEWAVAPHRVWSLPGTQIESDPELARQLANAIPGLQLDAAAHQQEHGVEVELPFIAKLSPETKVVAIAVGGGNLDRCDSFADGLAKVIQELDEPPLLLISSDMNHFANDAETRRLDEMALAPLEKLDADALYETVTANHISMCGVLPAVIIMKTLEKLGALHSCERVGYGTSADTTGDTSRVVGYAGVLFK